MLAGRTASQLGMPNAMIQTVRAGGLLHDVGKLLVPLKILQKKRRLNPREWSELKSHPEMGVELLDRAGVPDEVCEIVLFHHERYDGMGYPDHLAGRAINWTVRLVSVMDAFDALTTARELREPMSIEAARTAIAREAGRRFCPWAVCALLSMPVSLLKPQADASEPTYRPDARADVDCVVSPRVWTALVPTN